MCRASGSCSRICSSWATPMTPFSGVRSSWLTLLRNSVLVRSAARACASAPSSRRAEPHELARDQEHDDGDREHQPDERPERRAEHGPAGGRRRPAHPGERRAVDAVERDARPRRAPARPPPSRFSIRKRRPMSPSSSVVTRKPMTSRGRSASADARRQPVLGHHPARSQATRARRRSGRRRLRRCRCRPERRRAAGWRWRSPSGSSRSALRAAAGVPAERRAAPGGRMTTRSKVADLRRGADVRRDPVDVAREDVLVGVGPDRVVEQRRLGPLDEGLEAAGHHPARGGLRRHVLLAGHPERRGQRRDHQQDDRRASRATAAARSAADTWRFVAPTVPAVPQAQSPK